MVFQILKNSLFLDITEEESQAPSRKSLRISSTATSKPTEPTVGGAPQSVFSKLSSRLLDLEDRLPWASNKQSVIICFHL